MSAVFVERELILRSRGRTRYLRIPAGAQAAGALLAAALLGWSAAATLGAWRAAEHVAVRDSTIATARDAQRQLLQQLALHQDAMGAIARDLHEKQRVLRQLFEENEALKSDLVTTEERLRSTEAERTRVADARSAVRRQMTRLEAELLGMSSENGALSRHLDSLREQLGALEARNADLAALRAAQERRLHALDDQLAQAAARAQLLQAEAGTLRQTLARAERDRDEAVGAGATLRARVADLEGRLAANEELHRRTVQRYADHALANILQLEALVGRTGVKADALLPPSRGDVAPSDSRRRGGQGGPFVPWRPGAAAPPPLEELGLALADRIDRLELLRELVRALPLNAPLDEATQMSGFGYRRDPITNAPAMHLGIDFSAPMRSPVYPAAPGEVVFAGWQGDYGRVVDVDHGFGIRTRYAHLARIDVAAGERVAIGRSIGLLGNSGRTTGPHLHYEVLVKGRNVDPMKFMRARSHVLQAK